MPSRFFLLVLAVGAAMSGVSPSHAASDKPAASVPTAGQAPASPAPAKRIDINSASRAQLKTLPGIGDAEADRIIAARPYPSKAKLGADKVAFGPDLFRHQGPHRRRAAGATQSEG